MPTYRFTGLIAEDFPEPPLARRLEPGQVVDLSDAVEHARLELVDPSAPAAKAKKE
jgi:hypothetical protein